MTIIELSKYDREALLAALRRDYREESNKVFTDPQWSAFHRENARKDISLLQLINPKKPLIEPRLKNLQEPLGEIPVEKAEVTP